MERVLDHLELVSLPALFAGLVALVTVWLATPQARRLESALAAMAFVLTLGRLPNIGPAANLAKVGSGFLFLLVIVAALWHPGRRSRLTWWYWGYVALGLLSLYYVKGAEDVYFASALRAQWLLLALAAVMTARTVVDQATLVTVLRGVFLGLSLGCILTFLTLVNDPAAAFRSGFGRFTPYGCNPNQIGVSFAVCAGIGLYFAQSTRSMGWRIFCFFIVAIALGQSILTVSRGSFMVLILLSFPVFQSAYRRPAFLLASLVLVAPVVSHLMSVTDALSFDRLNRGLVSRTETTAEVLEEVKKRPYFGVGFTSNLYVYDTDLNAHNAYVSTLYLGGLSLAAPLFTLQLWSLGRTVLCYRLRHRLPYSPQLLGLMGCLSLAIFAQGFVNDMSYYPTYTWAFLNVFVACTIVGISRRPRAALAVRRPRRATSLRSRGDRTANPKPSRPLYQPC